MTQTLKLTTDNTLKVLVVDAKEGIDVSGATVTYSLRNSSDTEIDSGACAYDTTELVDSTTYYRFYGNVADTVSLVEGDSYTAIITIDAGAGLKRTINEPVTAELG